MKKIKIEQTNEETGQQEVVALNATSNSFSSNSPNSDQSDLSDFEIEGEETSSDQISLPLKKQEEIVVEVKGASGEATTTKLEEDGIDKDSAKSPKPIVDVIKVNNETNEQQVQHKKPSIQIQEPDQNPSQIEILQPTSQEHPQPQLLKPQQNQSQPSFPNIQRALPPNAPANYCNICNKELCNKYFMKTHMQKMHGINLDDYPREAANSGGVVCDICQKELCSKYFLKVHKSNTHGITDFASGTAGSQAANAATAVAAIALTNYSLNNAQKRAALNLALNQHQLQNRQAAALMNAAAASAAFNPLQMAQAAKVAAARQQQQRNSLNSTSLIGHLKQKQSQPQKLSNQLLQQQQQHQQQQQPIDLQTRPKRLAHSPPNNSNNNNNNINNNSNLSLNLHAALPAAFLANSSLLTAHLAQQQQNHSQIPFSPLNAQQAAHQQPQHHQQQNLLTPVMTTAPVAPSPVAPIASLASNTTPTLPTIHTQNLPSPIGNEDFNDIEDDNSERESTSFPTTPSGDPLSLSTSTSNNSGSGNSNSRYLRHYTEACFICDRRFKSIKWLQSHVMNDHKPEIGNLFTMLVQAVLLCNNGNSSGTNICSGSNAPNSISTTSTATTTMADSVGNINGNITSSGIHQATSLLLNGSNPSIGVGGGGIEGMGGLAGTLASLVSADLQLQRQLAQQQQQQ